MFKKKQPYKDRAKLELELARQHITCNKCPYRNECITDINTITSQWTCEQWLADMIIKRRK